MTGLLALTTDGAMSTFRSIWGVMIVCLKWSPVAIAVLLVLWCLLCAQLRKAARRLPEELAK